MNGCFYRREDDICDLYTVNRDLSYCIDPEHCDDTNPTHLDLLRVMPDDELAEFIANKRCPGGFMQQNCNPWGSCKDCWKAWLNLPTKEVKR